MNCILFQTSQREGRNEEYYDKYFWLILANGGERVEKRSMNCILFQTFLNLKVFAFIF